MNDNTKSNDNTTNSLPVSLNPLTPKEALRRIVKAGPMPPEAKEKGRPRKKKQ